MLEIQTAGADSRQARLQLFHKTLNGSCYQYGSFIRRFFVDFPFKISVGLYHPNTEELHLHPCNVGKLLIREFKGQFRRIIQKAHMIKDAFTSLIWQQALFSSLRASIVHALRRRGVIRVTKNLIMLQNDLGLNYRHKCKLIAL